MIDDHASKTVLAIAGSDTALGRPSPDGSRIAFIKDQGQQLAVMRADGAGRAGHDWGPGYYESPTWSHDGRETAECPAATGAPGLCACRHPIKTLT